MKKTLTAAMVKECAKKAGADLCGIANIERFCNAPPETNPLNIMPNARSVVVLAGRILEGSYKGIETNSDWSSYWIYGYGTGIYGPLGEAMTKTMQLIESYGYETVQSPGSHTILPHEAPPAREPVKEGKMPSNVVLHMRLSAAAAGLGELGWSKVFLTPQFGPRQRFEIFITDAVLEPDPLYKGHICTRCMKCVDVCPSHALSKTKKVSVQIEDRTFEWGDVDLGKCKLTHWGLNELASPFIKKDVPGWKLNIDEQTMGWYEAFHFGHAVSKRSKYLTTMSTGFEELGQGGRPGPICGAYGCIQACYRDLKARGKVGVPKRETTVTKKELLAMAKACGIDLVAVAPAERFRACTPQFSPLSIFPEAKSIILCMQEIPRGSYRGIEEGTLWTRAGRLINARYIYSLARMLEDMGGVAVPSSPLAGERWPEGVKFRGGQIEPNVYPDLEYASVACGAGQISLTGQLVTKEFGVRQALGLITTDLVIEPDDLFTETLCDGKCEKTCPMDAIDAGSITEREVCGVTYRVAAVDRRKCRYCPNGAFPDTTAPNAEANRNTAACTRDCVVCLEQRGIGTRNTPFRQHESWGIDLSEL